MECKPRREVPGSGGKGGHPQALEVVTEKQYIVQHQGPWAHGALGELKEVWGRLAHQGNNRRDKDKGGETEIEKLRVREICIVSRYKGTGTGPMQKGMCSKYTKLGLGTLQHYFNRYIRELVVLSWGGAVKIMYTVKPCQGHKVSKCGR
ncbi:hypothetical protein GG344DRAFT_69251 [Lentinula edodes]|nr:hypothetical protein GG344DRAFT_69251 [Lentinula edodes]